MTLQKGIVALVVVIALVLIGIYITSDDGAGALSRISGTKSAQSEQDNQANTPTGSDTGAGTAGADVRADNEVLVRYTNTGFEPFIVELVQGQAVVFRNETDKVLFVTTENHPTATNQPYPGFSDSVTLAQGEEWSIALTSPGVFGYKNDFNDEHLGAIVVKPQKQ